MRPVPPIELLTYASEKLGDLSKEVVFLGGAIVGLLITEKGGPPPRVTKDVDVAIQLSGSLLDIYALDRRLLSLGFINDIEGPQCRYLHGTTVIDVIPVHPGLPDDTNGWYPLAIESAEPHTLPNGIQIKVIAPASFVGTKLVAFRSLTREHHDDVFLSRDFGDIVRLIDGRPTLSTEILEAREDLLRYIQAQLSSLLNETYIEHAITEHVDPGRESLVLDRLRAVLQ